MSSNSVINFKVFLRDGNTSEARRFAVDAGVVTSLLFIKEKLQNVIPSLKEAEYKLTWKDADGDEITITSDEDLITAYTEMNSNIKVFYVTIINRMNDNIFGADAEEPYVDERQARVVCDGCEKEITGIRFKCLQCPDFDLCADCEHRGLHTEHLMMRMPHNFVPWPRCGRRNVHHFFRSMRKSAHHASREAHRAMKHCAKNAAGENKQSTSETKGKTEEPKTEENKRDYGCPFSTGEGLDYNQISALTQHIGPFLEALSRPSANQTTTEPNGDVLSNIIKNAMRGFFGSDPEGRNESENEPRANTNNNNEQNSNETQQIPMDVETNTASGGVHTNSTTDKGEEKRREPGWTFVANENVDQPTSSTQTSPTASAPIFIPHENPQITEGLKQLSEMGFSNENNRLTHLLERYNGNVSRVVKTLLEMSV